MRRLLALLGGLALARAFLRRRPADALPDPRADELRRKLEESRGLEADREEFESGETPVDMVDADARRRDVHERGRAALDDMRRPDGGSG